MTADADLVVTGIGVVTEAALDPEGERTKGWFDHRAELGRGYKYLPRASQYLLAATARALTDTGAQLADVSEDHRAITVGTNNGMSELQGEFDRTVIEGDSTLLSPATVPYFSVNLVGSRVAMEHGLKGFSLGVHSPRVAGLEAVQHGVRALRAGRARWLLTGAAESPLDWSEPGSAGSEDGAVALVVERAEDVAVRGGRAHGRVQVRSFLLPPPVADSPQGQEQAERLLAAAFAALGLARRRPQVWLIGGDDAVTGTVEAALGEGAIRASAGAGCLGPAVQVAALLREAFVEQLVIGVAAQGNVSVAHVVPGSR
ncbi:3-oxoacyl-ACP synthase [Streptomyces sp. HC44]|uniref:3-oxoacyl-ACP synthase n=1 Tax=Streptomyces scabichelini TaxID=2711217 RepID=A0A6G4VEP7_9ACTN|nr:beta-ketoacyl synthase N-terminal-like domain-containing protein [Streptomyces scabichelini]NGO12375.1 3-oxoacyl-ACP synthase [Streptomyces scabichelini]